MGTEPCSLAHLHTDKPSKKLYLISQTNISLDFHQKFLSIYLTLVNSESLGFTRCTIKCQMSTELLLKKGGLQNISEQADGILVLKCHCLVKS